MTIKDRQALKEWDLFKKQIKDSTYIDLLENEVDKRGRIKKLEADFEKWAKYYFPKFATAEPEQFHKDAAKHWIENDKTYHGRAWSRELAKSTRAMIEDMYLMLTKRGRFKILISHSYDNAVRLLSPYKANLEVNQRIINDYGQQKKIGNWEADHFISQMGFGFLAMGMGQSPRGIRLEEIRPDILDFDDCDTDEDCRNPKIIIQKWKWVEEAAIPAMSISGKRRIRFNGNLIAKDCCMARAMLKAKFTQIINIRNKKGKSSWPAKNSEADIDHALSEISYSAQQKEYFNNPISEGTVFKEMHYKQMRPLHEYRFLVGYSDLSYKSSAKNDFKAVVLVGRWKEEYHIIKCFVRQCTTSDFAKGMAEIHNWINGRVPVYWYAECNFLQDIIIKELQGHFKALKVSIVINEDKRKKADKFYRIETTLEPLNTNGRLFLNEEERNNPNMQILEEQFKIIEPGSRGHDDAPDATEGAKQIIDSKYFAAMPMTLGARHRNKKRI